MNFKAFLFDCDGTIINTDRLIMNAWRAATDFMLPGKPVNEQDLRKHFGRTFDEAAMLLAQEFGVDDYNPEEVAEVYWTYHKGHPEDIDGVFPTVAEALKSLKAKGIPMGIVTSGFYETCSKELEELGVRDFFDVIVGAGDVTQPKPNAQPALICCERLGVEPKETLLIGDSKNDIACGNNAGCTTAIVSWSLCNIDNLEGVEKPDMVISDAKQLLEYI